MTNNVNTHILKDLFNLVFFSGKGSEIYMQKEYTLEWEFVPADVYKNNFLSIPKGYIAGEVSEPNEDEDEKIPRLLSLIIGVTDGGKFTHNTLSNNYQTLFSDRERHFGEFNSEHKSKIKFTLNNQTTPQTFELPLHDDDNGDLFRFTFETLNIKTSNEDKVYGGVAFVDIDDEQYVIDLLESHFKNVAFYFPFIKYVGDFYQETVSTGFIAADTFMVLAKNNSGIDMNNDIFHRPHIGEYINDPQNAKEPEFAPYVSVTKTIDNLSTSSSSTTNTPLLFGAVNPNDPLSALSRTFQLVFQPTNNSEIFILDHDINYNLLLNSEKSKEYAADLFNVDPQYENNPITFGVGFRAQQEGCYQNFLGIYLRNLDNDQSFFMGVLNIKTLVEGEDERFRTLLTNFGIPDPIKYSNIFKEVDYEEAGYDYTVINKKSKELFLTYDKIFSHVGTYKALLNAVKFLGYSDIIFKEWYKFRDVDNKMHNLAVRRVDLSSENYVKFHDEYGIDFEKYINYTKLNKLTMIYHLNELADDPLYLEYKQRFIINNKEVRQTQYMYDLIPNTVPVYELRNDEILAKLFGVKEWLEAHIIGVGAYIADISGEGLYLGGVKNQLYSTMHHLADYHEEEYVTPVITNVSKFNVFEDPYDTSYYYNVIGKYKSGFSKIEYKTKGVQYNTNSKSSVAWSNYGSTVECTLTEYTGLTFEDYKNVSFESFERISIPVEVDGVDHLKDENGVFKLKIGNPIETPVLFDEIEYGIDVVNGTGTVHEFKHPNRGTAKNNSELFVADGEITLLSREFENNNDILPEFLSCNYGESCIHDDPENTPKDYTRNYYNAPTIFIETGTLRNIESADWLSNVIYSINEELSEDGEVYKVTNIETGDVVDISPKTIILKPHIAENAVGVSPVKLGDGGVACCDDNDLLITYSYKNYETKYASFKYTMDNKFGVPVIVVNGYDVIVNDEIAFSLNEDTIIDIITGRIEFRKHISEMYENEQTLKTEIFFSDDNRYNENDLLKFVENPREQVVTIRYEYLKDSKPLIKYNGRLSSIPEYHTYTEHHYDENVHAYVEEEKTIDLSAFSGNFESFDKVLEKLESITEINAKVVNIKVNRTGDYTVKAKTFDKFNNMFVAESDKVEHVETQPININVYVRNLENSNNSPEIYPLNTNGILVDNEIYHGVANYIELNPKINYHYHSENIEFTPSQPNTLEYLNITYALDTPKNNEHILLYPTKTSKPYDVNTTISFNKNEIHGYTEENTDWSLCYYECTDGIKIYDLEPFENNEDRYNAYRNNEYYYSNYDITKYAYYNDPNETKCSILVITDEHWKTPLDTFKVNDVVKITYEITYKKKLNNISDSTIVNSLEIKTFTNSLCYRITNIENNTITLNGWLDEYILGLNKPLTLDDPTNTIGTYVKIYMAYPHMETAYYDVEITEDADEYKTYINDVPYLKTNVKFNDSRLFINDYLDNNYRLYLYDFDPSNIEKIWWSNIITGVTTSDSDTLGSKYAFDKTSKYYKYVNFPITYERGGLVIAKVKDPYYIDNASYHEWIWQTYYTETGENYDDYKSGDTLKVLFKSTNKVLNVFPDMQGRQDIIFKSIDQWGNVFKNNGEGLLFLK